MQPPSPNAMLATALSPPQQQKKIQASMPSPPQQLQQQLFKDVSTNLLPSSEDVSNAQQDNAKRQFLSQLAQFLSARNLSFCMFVFFGSNMLHSAYTNIGTQGIGPFCIIQGSNGKRRCATSLKFFLTNYKLF